MFHRKGVDSVLCRQGGGLLPCNFLKLLFFFSPATFFTLQILFFSPITCRKTQDLDVAVLGHPNQALTYLVPDLTRLSHSILFPHRELPISTFRCLSLGGREDEKNQFWSSKARTSLLGRQPRPPHVRFSLRLRSLDPEVGNPGHGPTVTLESTTGGSIGTDAAFNRRQAGFHFDSVSGLPLIHPQYSTSTSYTPPTTDLELPPV